MAGVLTTAGLAKYNNAVATGTKIKVHRLVIGANTGAVSAATTSLGAELFSSHRVSVFCGLSKDTVSFRSIADLPSTAGWRNVGIYDDTQTLIAVERYNVAAAGTMRQQLIGPSLVGLANNTVFDNWMSQHKNFASISDTLRLVRQIQETAADQVPSAPVGSVYRWSSPTDMQSGALMRHVAVAETSAELEQAKSANAASGQRIFDAVASQVLLYSGGAWAVEAGATLASAFGINTLLWSKLTKKAYSVQLVSTLLRVI